MWSDLAEWQMSLTECYDRMTDYELSEIYNQIFGAPSKKWITVINMRQNESADKSIMGEIVMDRTNSTEPEIASLTYGIGVAGKRVWSRATPEFWTDVDEAVSQPFIWMEEGKVCVFWISFGVVRIISVSSFGDCGVYLCNTLDIFCDLAKVYMLWFLGHWFEQGLSNFTIWPSWASPAHITNVCFFFMTVAHFQLKVSVALEILSWNVFFLKGTGQWEILCGSYRGDTPWCQAEATQCSIKGR